MEMASRMFLEREAEVLAAPVASLEGVGAPVTVPLVPPAAAGQASEAPFSSAPACCSYRTSVS